MLAEVWIEAPCSMSTAARAAEPSGSSKGAMRSAKSMKVTMEPRCRKNWPSSSPMALAPMTTSRYGSPVSPSAVSGVRKPESASPGIAGTPGEAPVAIKKTGALIIREFTCTESGPSKAACPLMRSNP